MGIFDDAGLFTTYQCEIVFRDKVMGGTPKNPKLIEGWLRTKTGVDDTEEIRQMMLRTLLEVGAEVRSDMSYEELVTASESVAALRNMVGFKVEDGAPYLESRLVKAMFRECVNILFAGDRWKAPEQKTSGKGPKSFTAERVFVNPDRITLGKEAPDGVELFVGHPQTAQGVQSNLTYYEFCMQPTMEFELMVTQDAIDARHWPLIWQQAQEIGLGALRSQGYGRFDVTKFDKV